MDRSVPRVVARLTRRVVQNVCHGSVAAVAWLLVNHDYAIRESLTVEQVVLGLTLRPILNVRLRTSALTYSMSTSIRMNAKKYGSLLTNPPLPALFRAVCGGRILTTALACPIVSTGIPELPS